MALQQIANTDISSTGTFALGSVSSSTLTSGRVTYATTGGLLTDSSSLTFNGSTLTASSLSGGNITNTNLTSGRITYAATGGLLTDSANLVFTGSNVGIGTSSPADALNIGTGKKFRATHSANVYQQIFSSASGNLINAYGDNLGVYADVGAISLSTTAAQPITFETTNAERMRISAAGLVGIGTISPDAQLDVTRSGNGQIAVLQTSSSRGFSFESQSDTALQISSVQASTNMDLWANTLSFSAGGSERMRITSAGLVGIGTATPARVLELKAAQACMVFNDNTNVWTIGTGSFIDGSNSFNFYLGGVGTYLRINSSGNLGLGLGLVPSAWLASSKAMQIGDYASFWWDGYTGSTAIGNNVYQSGNTTDNYIVSGVASTRYRLAGGAHAWFIAPSGTAGNAITFTQAMTLDASGNVGIGTTSQNERLRLNSSTAGQARMSISYQDTTISFYGSYSGIVGSGNATDTMLSSQAALAFGAGGTTERMRIASNGLLLQGSTTATFAMPSINGASFKTANTGGGSPIVEIGNTDTTASSDISPALMVFKNSTTTTSDARFIQFSANGAGTTMGAIVGNGSGLCQFANYSDISLKKNIQPLSGSLSKIIALKPSSFDMISDNGHVNAGFIAQDVQKVYPEYVIENMANEGEKPLMAITGGMSGGFIAELVKAIQEQQALIESMATKLKDAGVAGF